LEVPSEYTDASVQSVTNTDKFLKRYFELVATFSISFATLNF